jgi:hypothetical protein
MGQPALAESGTQAPAQADYRGAQYVQVLLGDSDREMGLRLIEVPADGVTRPAPDTGGRQSVQPAAGGDRYFYFDVHDTYINGGSNTVTLTVTYRDVGLTPIFIEYDSFDPLRPISRADAVTRKRKPVAVRTNSEGWKTAFIDLDDARFAGTQQGGADFRIGSGDDLNLSNVSARLIEHREPEPPLRVKLDGNEIVFDPNDVQPFVSPETNRSLVPFRAVFNALGVGNDDIIWHDQTRTVEAHKGKTIIMLTIDSPLARVNDQLVKLDQRATIVGDRTVVPLRFVSEFFGLLVTWDAATRTVVLTTPPSPVQQMPDQPMPDQQPPGQLPPAEPSQQKP